ncbi:hypothetical protein LX36DRAFT_436939 [Colletotrichum falcatum]|nr:hypothetical protein LX36DRAFT_436939 [Colletotrichum falcatum]
MGCLLSKFSRSPGRTRCGENVPREKTNPRVPSAPSATSVEAAQSFFEPPGWLTIRNNGNVHDQGDLAKTGSLSTQLYASSGPRHHTTICAPLDVREASVAGCRVASSQRGKLSSSVKGSHALGPRRDPRDQKSPSLGAPNARLGSIRPGGFASKLQPWPGVEKPRAKRLTTAPVRKHCPLGRRRRFQLRITEWYIDFFIAMYSPTTVDTYRGGGVRLTVYSLVHPQSSLATAPGSSPDDSNQPFTCDGPRHRRQPT